MEQSTPAGEPANHLIDGKAILDNQVLVKPPEDDSQVNDPGKTMRRTAQLSSSTAQIGDSQNHKQIKLLF